MSEFVLNAEIRELTGKRAKHARLAGMVPGVYYAREEKNLNIQVPKPGLDPLVFTSETHVIDLRLKDGSSHKCILRDVQFDPVTDIPVHFDLQGLKENERLTIEVPVVITGGIPLGVREGGMVQHILHRLRISCLPKDIPEKVEIDITELGINHSIHVRDLKIPNVTLLENADSAVVGVLPPTVVKEAEAAPVAEEAIKEPEVVGKGKKPEEGEAAEPAKGEAKAAPGAAKPAPKEAKPAPKEEKKK
ncbi:MAG TPA: 50S ribosomal protein L25 [Bacteroidota bacterium]|nr:50S ribosomal protein L25 [Bacteroidota bacterium]